MSIWMFCDRKSWNLFAKCNDLCCILDSNSFVSTKNRDKYWVFERIRALIRFRKLFVGIYRRSLFFCFWHSSYVLNFCGCFYIKKYGGYENFKFHCFVVNYRRFHCLSGRNCYTPSLAKSHSCWKRFGR